MASSDTALLHILISDMNNLVHQVLFTSNTNGPLQQQEPSTHSLKI
jgi:hypothetical protein